MASDDSAQFVALLRTLLSADNAARTAAEKTFTEARRTNPDGFLMSVVACLDSAAFPDETLRVQVATLLRRSVVNVGSEEPCWGKASQRVQLQVKGLLFRALESEPSAHVRKIVIAGVSAIAAAAKGEQEWPDLVASAFTLAGSENPVHKESALRLLSELVATEFVTAVLDRKQELGALLNASLAAPALQSAAILLVCEMVGVLEADQQKGLQQLLPATEAALKALSAREPAPFEEALQALVSVVADNSAFFKPRLGPWVETMLTLANANETIQAGHRALAFEWVCSAAEAKPKALTKAIPNLPRVCLETAFVFLAQVKEDEGWEEVDEDLEEDDDDADDVALHKMGEAKIDFFVEKLGYMQTRQALFNLLEIYVSSPKWECRFAAATAIRAAVEYVDDNEMLDAMAKILIGIVSDSHMRVRYAALLALGQMCHDQQADFHERWHTQLFPPLVVASGDKVHRCSAMALGSLEAVVGDLDESYVVDYAPKVLEMLVQKIQSSSHKGVLEAALELMGAMAACLEGQFDVYYAKLMPMLLAFVSRPEAQGDGSGGKLRGKVFEAISLLGYAVGKKSFAPDFQTAMSTMLASPLAADDVQKEYIKESMDRMCQIMGPDFAPFLPMLLPGIFATISPEGAIFKGDSNNEDDVAVETEKGVFSVKTAQLEEMQGVVKLLSTFVRETGAQFFEYVKPTAEVLARALHSGDEVKLLTSDLRNAVYPCWADLVESTQKAVPSRGDEAKALIVNLVRTFVDKVGADLNGADDPGDIGPMADGIACVIRNGGQGCLETEQVKLLCKLSLGEIHKSFQREQASAGQTLGKKSQEQDEDEEEDADGDDDVDEPECRIGLAAVVGSCICVQPEAFTSQVWPTLQPLMQDWLALKGGKAGVRRVLGLHLAVDLCDHLKEKAVPIWPVFMDSVLEAVEVKDADERNAGAFAVNLAAEVSAFGPAYGARAYGALGRSLQTIKVKKNDEDGQRAQDNTVAALAQLTLSFPELCPDVDACWRLLLSKLPMKVDLKEGRKTHRKLFQEVSKPNGGNLGSSVVPVLAYLADIHGHTDHCDDELSTSIARSFASLPEATLASIVPKLTAKQQKALERVVNAGRALSAAA
eukprot:gnl/TRDRNA2_/TRDRNA2_182325_c0_seq1.p1 gnl/TRDRNA2_/TRDRNA2_182325_c0~~gnl/TRDRNA2_/TRDRNA2_182325_c0_seq1.p1  ORF type:complete len:1131 (+),score=275.97 gnl/TRDRNA2_/TRDRNA2_182325_c0_seq1:73-3393(+)